jgi:hypothetical protein
MLLIIKRFELGEPTSTRLPGMDFEVFLSMEKKKNKPVDLSNQVHSEFETSVGNSFNVVREETTGKKKREEELDRPLNQLTDDGSGENETGEEGPKW